MWNVIKELFTAYKIFEALGKLAIPSLIFSLIAEANNFFNSLGFPLTFVISMIVGFILLTIIQEFNHKGKNKQKEPVTNLDQSIKNDHSVTSNYQSGGVTAHTVNNVTIHEPPPRHLTDKIKKSILKIIQDENITNKQAFVSVPHDDHEAIEFGREIARFLIQEGFQILSLRGTSVLGGFLVPCIAKTKDNGLHVIVPVNKDFQTPPSTSQAFFAIGLAV
jgi:hypothetical protein